MSSSDSDSAAAPAGVRAVAGAVILTRATPTSTPYVLLVSARADPNAWILPKGGVEDYDTAGVAAAALRETWEEAGVRVPLAKVVDLGFVDVTTKKRAQRFHWVAALVGSRRAAGAKESGKEEIKDADAVVEFAPGKKTWPEYAQRCRQWVPLNVALQIVTKPHMVVALERAAERLQLHDAGNTGVAATAVAPFARVVIPVGTGEMMKE
ncbi:hypothetical protein GGF31_007935 [Allomyces arbusculus]|nr:hypothetical protein GGF31_007935 [Allomyces arbusculus]